MGGITPSQTGKTYSFTMPKFANCLYPTVVVVVVVVVRREGRVHEAAHGSDARAGGGL